jgi:DNA-binding PadR family transcriptional regulator
MSKMTAAELQPLLAAQKADALAAISAAQLAQDRADAMDYYLGNMDKDMPAQQGRSRAVSTDVADTVEGLLPSLMDIFAGSDEVVRFEPVGPEDEEAAQQETDYVNHVFMQLNPGFMTLYSFLKDGLLSKVGLVKVWWEETEQEERETYYDLTEDQFAALAQAVDMSDGAMKIVAHTQNGENEAAEPKEEAEVN